MNAIGKEEMDPTASVLEELMSFRDPNVQTVFEIREDRGWLRNLFAHSERWIEVRWIDDNHVQLRLLSPQPSSAIPVSWEPKGESHWLVPIHDSISLAEWINREWLQIRGADKMKLRIWND